MFISYFLSLSVTSFRKGACRLSEAWYIYADYSRDVVMMGSNPVITSELTFPGQDFEPVM